MHVEDVVLIRLLMSCTVIYLHIFLCKALCAMSCYGHSVIEVLIIIIIIVCQGDGEKIRSWILTSRQSQLVTSGRKHK